MADWKNGLCSCFGNFPVCALSYFVPCYVFGKTAEKEGEDCIKCGVLSMVPIANLIAMVSVRSKIREHRNIDGTQLNDIGVVCCCALCALVQQAREVEADLPGLPEMHRS